MGFCIALLNQHYQIITKPVHKKQSYINHASHLSAFIFCVNGFECAYLLSLQIIQNVCFCLVKILVNFVFGVLGWFFDECSKEKNRMEVWGSAVSLPQWGPGAKPQKILAIQHSVVLKTSFSWLSVTINSDKQCFTLNK